MRSLLLFFAGLAGCNADAIVHFEPEPDCACSGVDDRCVQGRCVQAQSSCTASSGCRAPYLCDEYSGGACTCDATPGLWEQCAPRCDDQTPCPAGLSCQDDVGLCFYPLQCVSSDVCPGGQACLNNSVQPKRIWDGNRGYHVSDDSASTCGSAGRPAPAECSVSSDCADSECTLDGNTEGRCEGNRVCADDEFRRGDDPTATCYIHLPCRLDESCPESYACRLLGTETSGYCTRPA